MCRFGHGTYATRDLLASIGKVTTLLTDQGAPIYLLTLRKTGTAESFTAIDFRTSRSYLRARSDWYREEFRVIAWKVLAHLALLSMDVLLA